VSGTRPPLPDGEGLGGTGAPPDSPGGAQGVEGHRPLEPGEQAEHTGQLARALQEAWLSGAPFDAGGGIDWLRFAHAVELRLTGISDWEPGPAEPFVQVRPVDTA
jgi:hypothetical protein